MEMIYILLGVLAGGFIVYSLARQRQMGTGTPELKDTTGFQLLLQQMSNLQKTIDQKLGDSEKSVRESMQHQSRQSMEIIHDITEHLTRIEQTNKQVASFTDQIRSLQDILKNPKQRGTLLGEYYLETILSKVLPPKTYQTQYEFTNGEKVDAAVFVGGKIIPIDSKFSLENYNRIIEAHEHATDPEPFIQEFKKDIKKRIDETAKYIRPSENTLDFAFMFIPHESIYYDLLVAEVGSIRVNTQDLIQYAFEKKVIIVSPTSFLAYLQTVLQGLRALKIEESAKDIVKRVEELSRHMKVYEEYHNKLGGSIQTVNNHYNNASKELKKVDKDVMRITDHESELEPLILEDADLEGTND